MYRGTLYILMSLFFVAFFSTAVSASSLSVSVTSQRFAMDAGQNTTVNAIVTGGNGDYTCSWSYYPVTVPSDVSSFGGNSCSIVFYGNLSDLATYDVVAVNANDVLGDMGSGNAHVTVDPELSIAITPSATTIYADNGLSISNSTINSTFDVFSGSGAYQFSYIVPGAGVTQSGNSFYFTSPGTYKITEVVNDSNGASASASANITVLPLTPPMVFVTISAPYSTIEVGQSDTVSALASGGISPYEYTWVVNGDQMGASPSNVFTVNSAVASTYHIYAKATDQDGNANRSSNLTINVVSPPSVVLYPRASLLSAGQNVTFTNSTTGGTAPYAYSYTENNTGGVVQQGNKLTFNNPGKYLVTLAVTDSLGGTAKSNSTVTVTPPLATALNANTTLISADQSVSFTNSTSGGTGSDSYSYFVSPNTGFAQEGNKITFSSAGTYNVTLKVTDLSGEVADSSVQITVTQPLATALNANTTLISADQSVSFTNSTSGGTGSDSYSYFVSPNTGFAQDGNKITFSSAGTYNVTLKVTDLSGEVATSSVLITVNPVITHSQITVNLNANRTYISADQSVKFTNTTSGGTGGNTYSYSVSPSSGFTQSGNKFYFTSSGNYLVTLHVSDNSGDTGNSTVAITVTPPLNTTLYANKTLISVGQKVKFTNSTTGGTGSNTYAYTVSSQNSKGLWSPLNGKDVSEGYGNFCGNKKNQVNVTEVGNIFTFSNTGNYTITLTVNDKTGEVATSSMQINVTPALVIKSFTANASKVYAGQSVSFANTTSGGTGSNAYSYTENNIAGVTQQGNKLTFADAGSYAVTLTAIDKSGETASATLTIAVLPPVLPGCNDGNSGPAVQITGSGKTQTVQITDQSAVDVTGSSDDVTIIMPGSNCNIAVDVTGSSSKVNVYNGTITLTMTGSSDVASLSNTIVSKQSITGSSDKVTGAILDGSSFTITGSSNLVESVQVESLGSLTLTGSGSNITIDMLTSKLMATTITGSSNLVHMTNGTITLGITGSSNDFYYHDTTIESQTITGSNNKLIKD